MALNWGIPPAASRGPLAQPALSEPSMTIDKSLKVKSGAIKNRNVLTRAERILKLQEADRWQDGQSVLGLPKVRVVKLSLKKKKKAKAEEGAEGAAPAAGAKAPAGAKPAAGGAKPAAGGAKPAG